ncbi:pyruvate/2-oxoglutarate dehydrogenase complex, dihydrolipoamide acyltransferase component [secondary endosymbiont of Heteropsylla cubana]|uniref:Dihydrolipoamide acetyltransferase component of pyruvate dehydrogenase complex n=1 Tax=secondary endosymbiont of Heteropsylla cubana TaxID=134287 RepID=J3VU04_9ENTR|nr:2-oxo acid dehydrogenase subunit E2 [secondary endosymbiont of Heteropsylla cubana]AFP85556.1 pyruvate/2-oxoglutarate dehydrogenase complex, dihydrolipoamide acyltransferase component [secondary endosymbiont of Heteropsylla cubana]
MAVEIYVPDIGIDEAEVTEILVKIGEKIELEQSLIIVEGDKASMELPAPCSGIVKEIKVDIGDKVHKDSLMMIFEKETNKHNQISDEIIFQEKNHTPASNQSWISKKINLPHIADHQVEIFEIKVKVGDKIAALQSLITVKNNNELIDIPAPLNGTIEEIKIKIGDQVWSGSQIMAVKVKKTEIANPILGCTNEERNIFFKNDSYIHATPLIRRLARKFEINLTQITGTGKKGRIIREDLHHYIKKIIKKENNQPTFLNRPLFPDLLAWPEVDFSKFGDVEEVEIGRIKKISGRNLQRNWTMIPHVTQFDEVDITDMESFRKQQNIELQKTLTIKVTPLVFIIKAAAVALEHFPLFNSSLSTDGQKILLKKYINIGIAVDTPNGLLVPVFYHVNKKSILEITRELITISKNARSNKLTRTDMQGGCFTISNLGGIGGTAFTPIINAPEVAILGISKSEIKPLWNGKEFIARLILPLSLSYDHRVIDGVEAAHFIKFINKILSDIRRLIL